MTRYPAAMHLEATEPSDVVLASTALSILPNNDDLDLAILGPDILAKLESISNGLDFRIGTRNAYQRGYSFLYTRTRTMGVFVSRELPNEARAGECMYVYWQQPYWWAVCGPPDGPPRQVCFRTDHQNLWDGSWIRWECNGLASRRNDTFNDQDWTTGGTIKCQTRDEPLHALGGF